MNKNNNKIPKFKTIQEEADFWDSHSINDFLPELTEINATFTPKTKKEE